MKVNELANTPNTIKDELAGVKETLQGIDMNHYRYNEQRCETY